MSSYKGANSKPPPSPYIFFFNPFFLIEIEKEYTQDSPPSHCKNLKNPEKIVSHAWIIVMCTAGREGERKETPVCSGGAVWWLGVRDNSKIMAWMDGMWESDGVLWAKAEEGSLLIHNNIKKNYYRERERGEQWKGVG